MANPNNVAQTTPGASGAVYGVDVYCVNDLDPYLALTFNALQQDVYHMITSPPGSIFWSTFATMDVKDLLGEPITPGRITTMQSQIESIIKQDERVAQVQCGITFDTIALVMTINITIVPQQAQPFSLIMAVSKLSVQLLNGAVGRH